MHFDDTHVYTAESDSCMRQCCGPQRGFTMHITDNFGQVSHVNVILISASYFYRHSML